MSDVDVIDVKPSMRILVNASTCVVGGGIQVASAFIRQAIQDPRGHQFAFVVSPEVMENLAGLVVPGQANLLQVTPSPAKIFRGRTSRELVRKFEADFRPDIVFSAVSPTYVRFRAREAALFANGWVTHPSPIAFKSLPLRDWLFTVLYRRIAKYWLRSIDAFQVENRTCQEGLSHYLGIPKSRVQIIPNSFSDVFAPTPSVGGETNCVRVFSLANPYPHKNLCIIPEVAALLRKRDVTRQYRFIVTLPNTGREVQRFWKQARKFDVETMIENVGRLSLQEVAQCYAESDVVFLPTLLETFSAVYPEAMVMGKPIVTTDLDFAHEICGDAAFYYAPLSAESAAQAIARVAGDSELSDLLVANGHNRLREFPSPQKKYQMQIDWLQSVAVSTFAS